MTHTFMIVFGFTFIFLMTTLGASLVFFIRNNISPKTNTILLGFASGIMISVSLWGLLVPAIEQASDWGNLKFLPAAVGFIVGGLFLMLIDRLVPHLHSGSNLEEGMHSKLNKATKLFLAVTIHNIPEGLAVGFAFGAASAIGTTSAFASAMGLAIGVGIQNLPEGAAVSLPMKTVMNSKVKPFLYGMFSGVVEPVFAVVGFFMTAFVEALQPWLLAFAAGAMIFVVVEDLIPEARLEENPHIGTWGVMIGFVVMMILDVALG